MAARELGYWRKEAVTKGDVDKAKSEILKTAKDRRGDLDDFLVGAMDDPGDAYLVGTDPAKYGLDEDEALCWLWIAACGGHSDAARALGARLLAESAAAPGGPPGARLRTLAESWLRNAKDAEFEVGWDVEPPPRVVADTAPAFGVGLVVVREIGDRASKEGADLAKRFGAVIGQPLPFRGKVPAPGEIRDGIVSRWPWAEDAARLVEGYFAVLRRSRSESLRLPNMLFVGSKGSGKSSLAEWLCRRLDMAYKVVPVGGVSDAGGLTAVTRAWATARPSAVFQAMASFRVANPALVLDEMDKTTTSGAHNGSVEAALLSLVGAESYEDGCLMANVDVSRVSYVGTANELSKVSEYLRDRFHVIRVPSPRDEDIPVLHANAVADFAERHDLDPACLPRLSEGEREFLADWFRRNGRSARSYYGLLERLLSAAMAEREAVESRRVSDAVAAYETADPAAFVRH